MSEVGVGGGIANILEMGFNKIGVSFEITVYNFIGE